MSADIAPSVRGHRPLCPRLCAGSPLSLVVPLAPLHQQKRGVVVLSGLVLVGLLDSRRSPWPWCRQRARRMGGISLFQSIDSDGDSLKGRSGAPHGPDKVAHARHA
jgi:hypothetical protein